MPNKPLKLEGMRMEPPPSLPVDSVHNPAASAAAAPPLEPPGVRSIFQGLRQASPSFVLGRRGNAELRGIGFAQYDCPGLADPLHYNRVHFSGAVLD